MTTKGSSTSTPPESGNRPDLDALRTMLARRGHAIPEADLADIAATVDGLRRALETQVKALDMGAVAEPFQQTLLSLSSSQEDLSGEAPAPGIEGLKAGEFSSVEWVQECLRRIDSSAPGRLAWREVDAEAALSRARLLDEERSKGQVRGPLHGVPVGVKDMFDSEGRVSGWGSPLRDKAAPAASNSTVIERLAAAGAIILGTQHMAEFALSPTGLNASFGAGQNPWNVDHVSGGSSSGGGMSVAAGHVPLAIGSDTGGSVRLPAALCGVFGLKPTQHRISLAGAMPLSPSMDCAGPIGNSVEACAFAFAAMAGADPRDLSCLNLPAPELAWHDNKAGRPLRLAVPALSASEFASQAVVDSFREAARVLADAGVQCIEVPLPELDLAGRLASIVLAAESAAIHRQWLTDAGTAYGSQVRRRLSRGFLVSGMDYYDALRLRGPLLRQFLSDYLPDGADALLLPVAPDTAPGVKETTEGDQATLESGFSRLSYWTRGTNYFGVPALSVPAGVGSNGLPLGVQFLGRPLGEAAILSLGRMFQQRTQWHLRRPQG